MEHENDNRTPRDRVSQEFMLDLLKESGASPVGACSASVVDCLPLAMVYAPMQKWRGAYAPDEALSRGTMFSELDKPFYPPKTCGCAKK